MLFLTVLLQHVLAYCNKAGATCTVVPASKCVLQLAQLFNQWTQRRRQLDILRLNHPPAATVIYNSLSVRACYCSVLAAKMHVNILNCCIVLFAHKHAILV